MPNETLSVASLYSQIVSELKDEELIIVGPDLIAFIQYWGANAANIPGVMLMLHKLAASVLADQALVGQAVVTKFSGIFVTTLQAAIDAAQARKAAP